MNGPKVSQANERLGGYLAPSLENNGAANKRRMIHHRSRRQSTVAAATLDELAGEKLRDDHLVSFARRLARHASSLTIGRRCRSLIIDTRLPADSGNHRLGLAVPAQHWLVQLQSAATLEQRRRPPESSESFCERSERRAVITRQSSVIQFACSYIRSS